MGNVTPLYPPATDEHYEDGMLPPLIRAMQLLQATNHPDRNEVLRKISEALLAYSLSSLEVLDCIRRDGYFDDNKLPTDVAFDIDNLMATTQKLCAGKIPGNWPTS